MFISDQPKGQYIILKMQPVRIYFCVYVKLSETTFRHLFFCLTFSSTCPQDNVTKLCTPTKKGLLVPAKIPSKSSEAENRLQSPLKLPKMSPVSAHWITMGSAERNKIYFPNWNSAFLVNFILIFLHQK